MSTFDAELFLQTTIDVAGSTQYVLPDEGVYRAMVEPGGVQTPRVTENEKGTFYVLTTMWTLDDSDGKIEAKTGRSSNKVPFDIFLDINEGGLDMRKGMNVPLNRAREALNQNQPGVAWAPRMMENQHALVSVIHRPRPDGTPQAKINYITALEPTATAPTAPVAQSAA